MSESRTATDRINQHPYYSRAWTYQEYLCAKRRLVFENGLVYWECSRSRWSEEVIPDLSEPQNDYAFPFIHPESSPPLLFMDHAEWATTTGFLMDYDNTFTPSFPDMRCMNDIIKNYNTMLFTFPEDALPAFSGIQQVLSQIFPGGLLFGIPEFFFEIGLAWNPTSMAKRRCSTRGSRLESRLPSWSFLGWQVGAIFEDDLEFHESCCVAQEYVKGFSRPVTTWYTLDQPTSSTARKVESHWSRYRTRAQDHTKSLIGKWKRERFPVGVPRSSVGYRWYYDRDNLEAGQEYSYTHANYPGRFYKYPIPVLETNKTQPLSRQTQFLSCRTSRAFIRGVLPRGESASPTLQLARHNLTHIQLQDEEGNFTGFVTLMQEEDRERFANSTPAVIDLELVAIAEGWFGIMNFDACGKAANTRQQDFAHRECIHVLWVQWNDGVAYRKGNGSVTKEVWERIKEKELVDLVLG